MLDASGRRIGEDCHLAFSPERVDPGNTRWGIRETPKVVGGMTAAELAKILENTFRAVNIALVNELAILADRMGIDVSGAPRRSTSTASSSCSRSGST
jgi:UDP-N-acetyl-D-glucosamine dehydrogenase